VLQREIAQYLTGEQGALAADAYYDDADHLT
jgi:hypothetical protein